MKPLALPHVAGLLRPWSVATLLLALGLAPACSKKTPSDPAAAICLPQQMLPGESYRQDFETDCHGWINLASERIPTENDSTPPKDATAGVGAKVGLISASSTQFGGPYYSSWLEPGPFPVTPGDTYCLELWERWPAGNGDGLVFGIRRFAPGLGGPTDLGIDNILMGPAEYSDYDTGWATPIFPNNDWVHLRKTFQVPSDTAFLEVFGNIDWQLRGDRTNEAFAALQGKVDGVRLSRGACEGQGFPSVCQAADVARGLRGEYYDTSTFGTHKLTRLDGPIAFDWGLRSPSPLIGAETFSAIWTGSVVPRFNETYTFITTSNDGVRLTVNGQVLINDFTDHLATERSGTTTATLEANRPHDIKLEYYDGTGLASVKLEWQSASQARQVVPREQLYPAATASCTSSQTLLGHWTFNETTGTTAADTTCNGGHGTLQGFSGPTWLAAGKEGGALTFNGTSNWVRVPDSAVLDSLGAQNQMTVSAWVRRTANQPGYAMVAMRQSSASVGKESWALGFKDDRLIWLINSQGPQPFACQPPMTSPPAALDTWMKITGTYDGTTARAYMNGVEVCSFTPATKPLLAETTPMAIGGGLNMANETASEFFKGDIDDVVLYDRALSASEVASTGVGGICTPAAGAPRVMVPGEILVEENGNTGQAVATFTVTALDDPSGVSIPVTCTPASGSTFPLGTTAVTCTAMGQGGSASASFNVRVSPRNRVNRVALLVTGNTNLSTADAVIRSRLLAAGYQVVLKTGSGVTTADGNNKALIVVTESAGNGNVGSKFNDTRVPVIVMNLGLMRDMALTADTFQDDKGTALAQADLEIVLPEHPLAAGFRERVTVTTAPSEMLWGRPAATAISVATLAGSPDQSVIFAYETGAALVTTSLEAPARRVGFFTGSQASVLLTAAGQKLLDQAIIWATQSEALLVQGTTPGAGDPALKARLIDLGYGFFTRTATQVQGAQADAAEMVVISESVTETSIANRLTSTRTPVVSLDARMWPLLQMTAGVWMTDIGETMGTDINIVNASHPLAAGLSAGPVMVASSAGNLRWWRAPMGTTAAKVATLAGASDKFTVFGYTTGSSMVGLSAPARRVGWFADAAMPANLTANGWKLFDAAIRWAATPDPTQAGIYALQAVHSNKCVDVSGGSLADQANLVQMECTGVTSQRWSLRELGGGNYEVSSINSNKCADVSGASTTSGADVVQFGCSGAANQTWKLIDVGSGQFQVQAVHSSKCMDVVGSSTANGTIVEQSTCNTGNNQRFRLQPVGYCAAETDAELCTAAGKNCGSITRTDRCGVSRDVVSCGTCTMPLTCGGGGAANVCGCTSESAASFCSRLEKNCGNVTAPDNCNVNRTYNCGTCSGFDTCGGGGTGNVCGCAPETLPQFCMRLGKNCGMVTGTDNCGQPRTAPSCGTCTAPQVCGAANTCVCMPESDAAFCSRLGKNCGSLTGADNCGTTRTVSSCGTCPMGQTCGGNGTPNVCAVAACSFSVTSNSYDGPNWWGTIAFKNLGPANSSNYKVEFDVPQINNVDCHCTNDAVPAGATLSPLTGSGPTARTTGRHCVFTWTNAPALGPNQTKTFNYSTDCNASSFTQASNVVVSDSQCTVCTPETDGAFCTRLGKNCGSVTAADNCGSTRTVSSCGSCSSPQTCGGGGTANVCGNGSNACTFTVAENKYVPADWWGTIVFKNDGPSNASNYKVTFDVPSGVHCDYSDSGWTFSQTLNTCVYVRSGTTIAAGAAPTTLNYSTDSNASTFKSASNLVVNDTVCTNARILQLTVLDTANGTSWTARTNLQVGSSGAHPWPDYASSYLDSIDASISASLIGKPWISTFSGSKNYNPSTSPFAQARLNLSASSTVYLVVDDRAPASAWSGWTNTGSSAVVKEAGTTNRTFRIYKKVNQLGNVDLPIQNYNNAFNYFVVVE